MSLHFKARCLLIVCATICGCQVPVLYSPPTAHAPRFEGGGQVEAGAFLSEHGVDASIAVSPVNHVALFAGGSWHDVRSDSTSHAFHAYREFGLSIYAALPRRSHVQIGGGWGYGTAIGYGFDYSDSIRRGWAESGRYDRPFGQFALQLRSGNDSAVRWDYGGLLRICRVGFDSFHQGSGRLRSS